LGGQTSANYSFGRREKELNDAVVHLDAMDNNFAELKQHRSRTWNNVRPEIINKEAKDQR